VPQNPVRRLLKPLLIPRPQQRVQQNVIRLERGVRFKFAAPVPLFMLLRKKKLPRGCHRSAHMAAQFLNFSEAQLWVGT
jgi:hypothetical protein